MSQIPTITGLLNKANAQSRVFDMGRRVVKLPRTLFQQVEEGSRPYPYPLQRQAWLGILFWDQDQPLQHFVWFLRFPLDETGLMQFAARDDFLTSVLQSLANQQDPECARIEEAHQESPYAFKPREERLAMFHSLALHSLKLPPTRYYAHARDYLAGEAGYDPWAFVGLQGLADVVVRRAEGGNKQRLIRAIPELPAEPLRTLCELLENVPLTGEIAEAVYARLSRFLGQPESDVSLIAALLRGLGASELGEVRLRAYREALDSPWRDKLDLLVAIAGRGWEALEDAELRLAFLEALAVCDAGSEVFAQVVSDLLFIPGMRPHLLASFRSPERSAALSRAIGNLMRGVA